LAGVSTRTLRHYERVGVLGPAERAANGYRTYPATALLDVLEIRRLQDAGLSLAEAAALRRDRATGVHGSAADRIDAVEADVDTEIERLERRKATLQTLRQSLAGGDAVLATGGADSFAPVAVELRRLGLTERAVDEQRRAWSALQSVRLPDRWQAAITTGLAQLEGSSHIDGFAAAIDALATLRTVDPSDPIVATTSARIATIVRSIPMAQSSLALAAPDALPIFAVVASCFAPAQILAMVQVIETLRDVDCVATAR
jgi:DNA-binding transcriptional MerR regulator